MNTKPLLEEIFMMTSDLAWRGFSSRLQRRCVVRWADIAQHLDTGCEDSENHWTWKRHHNRDYDGNTGKLFGEVTTEGLEGKKQAEKDRRKKQAEKDKSLMKKVKTKSRGTSTNL